MCLQCREGHHRHSQLQPDLFPQSWDPWAAGWAALHSAQVKEAHEITASFSLPGGSHVAFLLQGGQLYILPAVKEAHEITASFCLPSLITRYRTKADEYISHLVGHEGKGSLLSALKASGWVTDLTAGVGESGFERSTAVYVFEVHMTLTEAGLDAGPGEVPALHLSGCLEPWLRVGCMLGQAEGLGWLLACQLLRWTAVRPGCHRPLNTLPCSSAL